jgi:hypothetical protein
MTKFLIEANGQKFEVEAPDEATALAAFAEETGISPEAQEPTAQQRYDTALEAIRPIGFGNFSDEQFQQFAQDKLGPVSPGDMFRSAQVFGFGDELASTSSALTDSLFRGQDFGQSWQAWQELNAAREALGREQNGLLGTVAEVGGGLLSMAPARAAVQAAVSGVPQVATRAPSLLKTAAASGATGAGLGALYGFGATDGDAGERGWGAATGGALGGVVGTAAPVVAETIGTVAGNLLNRGASNQAARQIGMSPEAARFTQTRLAADDALGPAGQARMAQAGNEAMLVDAGDSARNTLDLAIQSSGRAGAVARDAIGQRVTRDAGAIQAALDQTLGAPGGVNAARAAVRDSTAGARSSAYSDAYAQPIDYSSQSGQLLDELLTRVDPAVIRRANALMRTRGEQSAQIMAQIGDDGSVTFLRQPDVRQIDYITRALNEEAQAGIGMGAMGGQTSLGSSLEQLSNEMRTVLRNHVPEYNAALLEGQDAIQQSQAIQRGYDLLRPSVTRETVEEWTRGMSPEARQGMLRGVRSKFDDTLANVSRAVSDGDMEAREAIKALRDLSPRAAREKLALAIGDDVEANRLFDEIDRATRSFELRAGVADNSRTFQRQEGNRQLNNIADPDGPVEALQKGAPLDATRRIIQALTGRTPERALQQKDAILEQVVRALTAQGPQAQQTAQALQRLGNGTARANDVARALSGLRVLSGPAANLSSQQLQGSQR